MITVTNIRNVDYTAYDEVYTAAFWWRLHSNISLSRRGVLPRPIADTNAF